MHRIDTPGATGAGLFQTANPLAGVPSTVLGHQWLNDLQENVAGVVEGAGLTLEKGNYGQLLAAVQLLVANVDAVAPAARYLLDDKSGGSSVAVDVSGTWYDQTANCFSANGVLQSFKTAGSLFSYTGGSRQWNLLPGLWEVNYRVGLVNEHTSQSAQVDLELRRTAPSALSYSTGLGTNDQGTILIPAAATAADQVFATATGYALINVPTADGVHSFRLAVRSQDSDSVVTRGAQLWFRRIGGPDE